MERININSKVDQELWKEVKMYCAEKNIKISEFIEESIKKNLNKDEYK